MDGYRARILTTIASGVLCGLAAPLSAQEAATAEKISLLDVAPPLFQTALRYPKYYSDPNTDADTVDGPLS